MFHRRVLWHVQGGSSYTLSGRPIVPPYILIEHTAGDHEYLVTLKLLDDIVLPSLVETLTYEVRVPHGHHDVCRDRAINQEESDGNITTAALSPPQDVYSL